MDGQFTKKISQPWAPHKIIPESEYIKKEIKAGLDQWYKPWLGDDARASLRTIQILSSSEQFKFRRCSKGIQI